MCGQLEGRRTLGEVTVTCTKSGLEAYGSGTHRVARGRPQCPLLLGMKRVCLEVKGSLFNSGLLWTLSRDVLKVSNKLGCKEGALPGSQDRPARMAVAWPDCVRPWGQLTTYPAGSASPRPAADPVPRKCLHPADTGGGWQLGSSCPCGSPPPARARITMEGCHLRGLRSSGRLMSLERTDVIRETAFRP